MERSKTTYLIVSERKFKSLTERQQNKLAAERALAAYNELAAWMGLEPVETAEQLSNRYHNHLERPLKEHNLLPLVRKGDRSEGLAYLPIAIYLDHLRSAHNVGSILRTTEALRLGEVVLSEQTPEIENKQVQDSSMGTWEWVSCGKSEGLDRLPRPIIALETAEGATPLDQFAFPETFTLVVGNEEYGCSEAILKEADAIVEIPLVGRKNSLNVANAFAIVAAEIRRQRR